MKIDTTHKFSEQSTRLCNDLCALYLHFLCDEMIQPAGVDVIVPEAFCLQQLNEVFNCGPEVASDGQLLHSHHHVPDAQRKHDT